MVNSHDRADPRDIGQIVNKHVGTLTKNRAPDQLDDLPAAALDQVANLLAGDVYARRVFEQSKEIPR
ncbi:hypothetical protein FCN77_18120 [Arthrobacter sp. 24S4-2]|nr:hypothetical protein FCN77_18120 [Arthrobacter sp. 24S4-2]